MVLGASGFVPRENLIDENTLVEQMYHFMIAGGVLPEQTTLEQAYPFLQRRPRQESHVDYDGSPTHSRIHVKLCTVHLHANEHATIDLSRHGHTGD